MPNFSTNGEVQKARLVIDFNGTQEKFKTWFRTQNLYISAHPDIFKKDKAKINLALTYMTRGLADDWAERYTITHTNTNGEIEFGTWKDFIENLEEFFDAKRAREDALAHVTHEKGQLEAYMLSLACSQLLGIFFAQMDDSLCHMIRKKVSLNINTLNEAQDASRKFDAVGQKSPLGDFPFYK
ncbi:hypothetical protein K443DRAFT_132724 [Laccaria amethystina LaAM-08-1]|uniref:Retrotransposon gag domain-containing protein n=1 Tax=Laccaria amethystina LaAM-08-1 TaxID=1095629 RepID=A0A0C9WQ51_9AGAR|nr:hypothetical protein K443DRAFT_132724 [Laccaria amethystina LaAM-08-1]